MARRRRQLTTEEIDRELEELRVQWEQRRLARLGTPHELYGDDVYWFEDYSDRELGAVLRAFLLGEAEIGGQCVDMDDNMRAAFVGMRHQARNARARSLFKVGVDVDAVQQELAQVSARDVTVLREERKRSAERAQRKARMKTRLEVSRMVGAGWTADDVRRAIDGAEAQGLIKKKRP
jgi:hypothetical protein